MLVLRAKWDGKVGFSETDCTYFNQDPHPIKNFSEILTVHSFWNMLDKHLSW